MAAAGFPQPPSAVMDMKACDPSQRTERGASAVEYGLLIVGIAGMIAVAFFFLGVNVLGLFQGTCASIAAVVGATC